jgi:hypothetical protein
VVVVGQKVPCLLAAQVAQQAMVWAQQEIQAEMVPGLIYLTQAAVVVAQVARRLVGLLARNPQETALGQVAQAVKATALWVAPVGRQKQRVAQAKNGPHRQVQVAVAVALQLSPRLV